MCSRSRSASSALRRQRAFLLNRARSPLARQLLSFLPSARVVLQRYTFTTSSTVTSAPRSAVQPVAASNTALRTLATSPSVSLGRVSCEVTVLACTQESSSSNPYGSSLCLAYPVAAWHSLLCTCMIRHWQKYRLGGAIRRCAAHTDHAFSICLSFSSSPNLRGLTPGRTLRLRDAVHCVQTSTLFLPSS